MPPTPSSVEETSVVICGGGPTGVVLSALLGAMQVPNVLLEREKDITTDPRGIALDEDGIRLLQSIGIYDKIYTEIGSCKCLKSTQGGNELTVSRYGDIQLRDLHRFESLQEATLGHGLHYN